jgi:hypothetical protein
MPLSSSVPFLTHQLRTSSAGCASSNLSFAQHQDSIRALLRLC